MNPEAPPAHDDTHEGQDVTGPKSPAVCSLYILPIE